MRVWWTLMRRELAGYYLSFTGYLIAGAAAFMMGFSFDVLLLQLEQKPTPMPVTELFYVTWYFWLILLLTTPVITMRLFALEKFTGTFETLMTAPVSDRAVVLAKFSAALFFYTVMWLPLLGCSLLIRHFSTDPSAVDAGTLGALFLGIVLFGSMLISVGCLASSLTKSQVSAAMLSLVFGASLFLLAFLAEQFRGAPGWSGKILVTFAFFDQMNDFARGIVDTRPVLLFCTFTFLFLFLTVRVIESRRWK